MGVSQLCSITKHNWQITLNKYATGEWQQERGVCLYSWCFRDSLRDIPQLLLVGGGGALRRAALRYRRAAGQLPSGGDKQGVSWGGYLQQEISRAWVEGGYLQEGISRALKVMNTECLSLRTYWTRNLYDIYLNACKLHFVHAT